MHGAWLRCESDTEQKDHAEWKTPVLGCLHKPREAESTPGGTQVSVRQLEILQTCLMIAGSHPVENVCAVNTMNNSVWEYEGLPLKRVDLLL